MDLKTIADHLQSLETLTPRLAQGSNLFVGEMPADCKNGVLLMPPYHPTPINEELPGWVDTEFAFVVRATDYDAGFALAWTLLRALTIQLETDMGPLKIRKLQPVNEPRPYRRSVGGYWEFEVDVRAVYVRPA